MNESYCQSLILLLLHLHLYLDLTFFSFFFSPATDSCPPS